MVTLKLLQNEFDALNKLARKTTNQQLVKTINNEYPHIREIQMENRELRACLNDRKKLHEMDKRKVKQVNLIFLHFSFLLSDQRALEHIMTVRMLTSTWFAFHFIVGVNLMSPLQAAGNSNFESRFHLFDHSVENIIVVDASVRTRNM